MIKNQDIQKAQQLSLFSVDEDPLSHNQIPTQNKENTLPVESKSNPIKPLDIGSTSVEYIQSSSLLTSPGGFIKLYKFTLNPYSGCSFGCDYCYARAFSPNKELQQNWGKWIKVKENAIALLRRSYKAKSQDRRLEKGDTIYMSTVTDPYQPIEHKVKLTRRILEELIEIQPRLTIQTRSPMVIRDIDLLRQFKHIRVNFTITTDSEDIRLRYEGKSPSIMSRLKAASRLKQEGIPIGVSISPMLPIIDTVSFGNKILELNANEYVTQFFKPTSSRFSAGTSIESIQKMKEDEWNENKYQKVRQTLISILGDKIRLLEGNEGYAPAE